MRIIGQKHIATRLEFILPYLLSTNVGENLLFRGPSGYGKTRLAIQCANYLTNNGAYIYDILDGNKNPERLMFDDNSDVLILDEIHLFSGNIEILYPYMDLKNKIFLFCTNDTGNLPEAFLNRCIQLIFTEYTPDELMEMCIEKIHFPCSEENLRRLIYISGNNPRILLDNYIKQMNILFKQMPEEFKDFNGILKNKFNIDTSNLDPICRKYLEILKVLQASSISRLSAILHIDQNTLTKEVEPVLLSRGLILITNKGRVYVNNS